MLLLGGPASALSLMTGLQCRQGQLLLGLLTAPIREVTPTDLAEWLCCAHVASFSFSWAAAVLLASHGRSMQSGVRSISPIRGLPTRARETRSGALCVCAGEPKGGPNATHASGGGCVPTPTDSILPGTVTGPRLWSSTPRLAAAQRGQ